MAASSNALSAEESWEAVAGRNRRFDGVLFYAVRSTGIYCKPSCPSRRPRRHQVTFFFEPHAAEQAGYRPCRRCHPDQKRQVNGAVELVRQACRYIEENLDSSLSLQELAAQARRSPYFLQRTFKQVTGISPRQYVEARRLRAFKTELRLNGRDVTAATYEAGYGSGSRVYEKAAALMGMTPAQYRKGAPDVRIRYTIVPCPLGRLLLAATDRGVCSVKVGDSDSALLRDLAWEHPKATIEPGQERLAPWVKEIVRRIESSSGREAEELPLDIRATTFQRRVFEELKRIPRGETRSYSQIAEALGMPGAQRAVGSACAQNPVALLIPCHRVVRAGGGMGGYRWGLKRKRELLAREKNTLSGPVQRN